MTEPAEVDEFLRVNGYETLDEFLCVNGYETLDDYVEDLLEAQSELVESQRFYEDTAKRRRDLRRELERDRGRKRRRAAGASPQAASAQKSAALAAGVHVLTDIGISASKIAKMLKLSRMHVYRLRKTNKDKAAMQFIGDRLGITRS
jgi:hypothetical protein